MPDDVTPPSKSRWRLTPTERELIAMALVEFAATVGPEWALGYPHHMYEIASKLNITERIKAYAKRLDEADAGRLIGEQKR